MCHITRVTPFRMELVPGEPVADQLVRAAKRAILSGQLKAGEPFPSVRALAKAAKVHPNTAAKVVAALTQEGLLAVFPGVGTLVAEPTALPKRERLRLIRAQVEALTLEAIGMGMQLEEVMEAVQSAWHTLAPEVNA